MAAFHVAVILACGKEKFGQRGPLTLDAILPGDNPVAIIKFRGESAVVSVGQEIWNVVVELLRSGEFLFHKKETSHA
ncbi:MAG: hypothetical protein MJZ10_13675 [Fibrobacter sp.]|nr:hypothetical protein [Fibrobacter sp.]